jgi:hypothetical protein
MSSLPSVAEDFTEDQLQTFAAFHFKKVLRTTVWFHVPNGEKRDKRTAEKLKRFGVRAGVADFILYCRGLALAVELKKRKGRQSDDQEGFQAAWEANGGTYVICRTTTEIEGLRFKFQLD